MGSFCRVQLGSSVRRKRGGRAFLGEARGKHGKVKVRPGRGFGGEQKSG